MTQDQTAAPVQPPKLEDLVKRIEALEINAGFAPRPPNKETVTAYYKDKKSGKTIVFELPPIVYQEARNGRLITTEQPSSVTDENGRQQMVFARWVVGEDADAWSLEDPDKDKKPAEAHPAAPHPPAASGKAK